MKRTSRHATYPRSVLKMFRFRVRYRKKTSGQLLTKLAQPGSNPVEVGIPSNCALVGVEVSVQGASWDGLQLIGTNALDLVIGSF